MTESLGLQSPGLAHPRLPSALSSFGAVVLGDCLYVYGGHTGPAHSYSRETTSNKFRRLSLVRPKAWEELPPGPKLQGLALVAHGGQIYRLGGMQPQNARSEKTDTRSQAIVARFDPAVSLWTEMDPLPEARSSHDAVVFGDSIFVFGGWRLNGLAGLADWLDHGWRLDLTKPSAGWQRIDQPFRRRALTASVHENRIWIIGGMNESGKIERTVNVFDPQTGEWSRGPDLPVEGAHGFTPSSVSRDNRLYVAPADGHVYQLQWDQWVSIGTMRQPRFAARMVAGPEGRLVVVGGATAGGLLDSVEVVVPS